MKLGLSLLFALSRPLREVLPDVLRRAHEEGVEVIELVDEGLHHIDGRRLRFLRRELGAWGFELAVHGPFVDMNIGSPHEPTRRLMLRRHLKSMEMASRLGATTWVFHPGLLTGVSHFYPGIEWRQSIRSVRTLLERAGELGLRALIENGPEPVPFLLKRAEDFKAFFADLGPDVDLGLVFDVGHAHLCGQVNDFLRELGHRVRHVHAHENSGRADTHMAIGSGHISWPDVLAGLRAVGYRGPIVVESIQGVWESVRFLRGLL